MRAKHSMVDYEIRRQNLRLLLDRTFGVNARGAKSRAAERLGKTTNLITRCLTPASHQNARRIDDDLARQIEAKFALPTNSMDAPELGSPCEPLVRKGLPSEPGQQGFVADRLQKAERATLDELRKLCELIFTGLPSEMQKAVNEANDDLTVPVKIGHLRVLMELTCSNARVPTNL